MDKKELCNAVFETVIDSYKSEHAKKKITEALIDRVIDCLCFTIYDNLNNKGDEVSLSPLGKFKVYHRDARTCRNPQTGGAIEVPAKLVPKFRCGTKLKKKLKG